MRGCPGYSPRRWLTDILTRAFEHAMTGIMKQAWRTDRNWDHQEDLDAVVLKWALFDPEERQFAQGKAGIHTSS